MVTAVVTSSSSATDKANASWIVRAGLANSSCVSFESKNTAGSYLRHQNYQLYLHANDGSSLFAQDATFCPQAGKNGQGNSFVSVNYPTRYIRHYNNTVYIASNGGSNAWDSADLVGRRRELGRQRPLDAVDRQPSPIHRCTRPAHQRGGCPALPGPQLDTRRLRTCLTSR